MSTTGVTQPPSNAGKPVPSGHKAQGTGERTKEAGAATGATNDLFALLLGMAGAAPEPALPVATGDAAEPLADPIDPAADAGLADAGNDPVQAMLQSRYPLEWRGASASQPAREGIDLAALGLKTPGGKDDESFTLPDGPDKQAGIQDMAGTEDQPPAATPARAPAAGTATGQGGRPAGAPPIQWKPSSIGMAGLQGTSGGAGAAAPSATISLLRGQESLAWSAASQARSTVALDPRSALEAVATPLGAASAEAVAGAGLGGSHAFGQPGSDGGQGFAEDGAADLRPVADGGADTDAAEEARAWADEAPEEVLAHWEAGQLQQARLSIGEGDEAIDVQLQLAGQAAQVALRTDDEQARSRLMDDAGQALAERLAQEGITLADLSLGSRQGFAGRQDGRQATPSTVALARSGDGQRRDAPDGTAAARPRTDGSRPLDLFV